MNKKKFKAIFVRAIFFVLAIVMFFVLPLVKIGENEDLSRIYSIFVGKKSEFQGVIEVWNIDTFESGSISKASFISLVAEDFQNQNKGVYVVVRNLTEYECLTLLESGEMPDLFSCSYGVAEKISSYVQAFSSTDDIDIREEFITAGSVNGSLMGLAWCRGVYVLISTEEKLSKAGIDTSEGVKLSDIALTSGFEVESSGKTVYSLCYGTNKYLLPKLALSAYNDSGVDSISQTSILADSEGSTSYEAYCSFLAGESTILLGTARDVLRMENRVKNGKISDVIYQPLTEFSDMVQFALVANTGDSLKAKYAESFAKFLTSTKCQEKLASFGMFAVKTIDENLYSNSVLRDIALEINGKLEVLNIFISESEIEAKR